ncbi:MAG: winged helix-turn-helix domain-containing protein, partial [Gemmatimonas sp.]
MPGLISPPMDALHFERRPAQRQLLADGRPLELGARALDLLCVLVEHAGQLVTKDSLLDRVWPDLVVEEANLHVQVSTLRRLLGREAIATVPGRGYQFVRPLQARPAAAPA